MLKYLLRSAAVLAALTAVSGLANAASGISASKARDFDKIYNIRYEDLKASDRKKVDAATTIWVETQLAAFRAQLEATPCLMPYLNQPSRQFYGEPAPTPKGEACDRGKHTLGAFHYAKSTEGYETISYSKGHGTGNRRFIKKKDIRNPDWPGNFPAVLKAVEAHLAPLAKQSFDNYSPYGGQFSATIRHYAFNSRNHIKGTEFLLRDGRTILGVQSRAYKSDRHCTRGECGGGNNYSHTIAFYLFDVRRVPIMSYWARSIDTSLSDERYFSAFFDAPFHHYLRQWEGLSITNGTPRRDGGSPLLIGRRADPRLLDTTYVNTLTIEPELEQLGRHLAQIRWSRIKFVDDNMAHRGNQAASQANATADRLNASIARDWKRDQAEWHASMGIDENENPLAAGIVAGINSAAQQQAFWNARAAEAQSRYFMAQYGCQAGFCAGGHGDRDKDKNGNHNGDKNRTYDQDHKERSDGGNTPKAANPQQGSGAAPTGSSSGLGSGATLTQERGSIPAPKTSSASAPASTAPATEQLPTIITELVSTDAAFGGTRAIACTAAKRLPPKVGTTDNSGLEFTGKIMDECACHDSTRGINEDIDRNRRIIAKRQEELANTQNDAYRKQAELSIQYAEGEVAELEDKLLTQAWRCVAKHEAKVSSLRVR